MIFYLAIIFLDITTPKVQQKKKKRQTELHQNLELLYISQDIITRGKWQLIEWEKIFAQYVSDKRYDPKYVKNSYNSRTKISNSIQEMGTGLQ